MNRGAAVQMESSWSQHVAVGFMPAFKYRQKNSLIVFERGHKAHGYVQTADVFLLSNRPTSPALSRRSAAGYRSPKQIGPIPCP